MTRAQASTTKSSGSKATVTKTKSSTEKKTPNKPFAHAIGRRKTSVARVWLRKGNGNILVNGRTFDEYFTVATAQKVGKASFESFPTLTKGMTADINLCGGGFTSQAEAIRLGIARALVEFDESLKAECRKLGYLTVDSRVKERKKPGQKAARAKFQFTKR